MCAVVQLGTHTRPPLHGVRCAVGDVNIHKLWKICVIFWSFYTDLLDIWRFELNTGTSVTAVLGNANRHQLWFICAFYSRVMGLYTTDRETDRQTDGQHPYCGLLGRLHNTGFLQVFYSQIPWVFQIPSHGMIISPTLSKQYLYRTNVKKCYTIF